MDFPASETDALGRTVTYTYDSDGRRHLDHRTSP